jgi:hypothetical protein
MWRGRRFPLRYMPRTMIDVLVADDGAFHGRPEGLRYNRDALKA